MPDERRPGAAVRMHAAARPPGRRAAGGRPARRPLWTGKERNQRSNRCCRVSYVSGNIIDFWTNSRCWQSLVPMSSGVPRCMAPLALPRGTVINAAQHLP
jgi:hypothetical protein